jgi:REP element-mobilizing transposase RayT
MGLNDAGHMVSKWYHKLENKFPDIKCDELICMPNHVHFILVNVGADLCVCPNKTDAHHGSTGEHAGSTGEHAGSTGEHIGSPLHRIVQWFKTMTTNEYIRNVKNNGWQPFDKKLWQRNYYEHIVRNETELTKIREYIINNPLNWEIDKNYTG